MKTLVIVESRAKGDKIQAMLGGDFLVRSCYGHVRDLPRSRDEIPAALKTEPWGALAIDIERGFKLYYVIPTFREGDRIDAAKVVDDLRVQSRRVGRILLATDPDREGEAIAAHLAALLNLGEHAQRITFNEITEDAVRAALASPRAINRALVRAQEARRALDRLCGYSVSPVLARTVRKGLSAGRVQSAALAALARQERARLAHVAAGYVRLTLPLTVQDVTFRAALLSVGGVPVATPKDFGPDGQQKPDSPALALDPTRGRHLARHLLGQALTVRACDDTPFTTRPPAPFTTSTMQQEASKQLKFSPAHTMDVAQRLYESGKITYMRTDSPALSTEATQAARAAALAAYGAGSLPPAPRQYAAKGSNAQEAHEAVRPAGKQFTPPAATSLTGDDLALYDLIYRRTVASQMTDLLGMKRTIYLSAAEGDQDLLFGASGRAVTDPGFSRAYQDASEAEVEAEAAQDLPDVQAGAQALAGEADVQTRKTPAPRRFTEASLVQALERAEVGRPSTYISILATLADRGYVRMLPGEARQLGVTFLGLLVSTYLEQHFPLVTDTRFTADMERELDRIAGESLAYETYLEHFWTQQLSPTLSGATSAPPTVEVPRVPGALVGIRDGLPTLKLDGQYVPIPDHVMPDDLTPDLARKILRGEAIPKKTARTKKSEGPANPRKRKT